MTFIIIVFLGTALLFYTLLGGADYGAGILELFTGKRGVDLISKAIAPVWEANHVWLIIVVVILFMAFPPVYTTVTTVLHIPLLILLIGIIFRGASFTFRYYDIQEEKIQNIYTAFFKISSLFTPFFLGVSLGAVILGRITLDMSQGFYRVFMHPWLNVFCFSLGLFVVILFAFLAALYLLGEAKERDDIALFQKYSKYLLVALVVSGGAVFLAGELDSFHLLREFAQSPVSIASVIAATILIPLLWINVNRHNAPWIRLAAGAQTFFVLLGWFAIQYPTLVNIDGGDDIAVANAKAPDSTLLQLIIALVVGLAVVIPALAYLFKVFKFQEKGPAVD